MNKVLNILLLVLETILMFGLLVGGLYAMWCDDINIPVKIFVLVLVPIWCMLWGWIDDFNGRLK